MISASAGTSLTVGIKALLYLIKNSYLKKLVILKLIPLPVRSGDICSIEPVQRIFDNFFFDVYRPLAVFAECFSDSFQQYKSGPLINRFFITFKHVNQLFFIDLRGYSRRNIQILEKFFNSFEAVRVHADFSLDQSGADDSYCHTFT